MLTFKIVWWYCSVTFTKYKQFVQNCFKICQRQALHAKSLGFNHPSIDKDVFFDSEIAEDMQQLIEKWRGYAKHQNSAERNQ